MNNKKYISGIILASASIAGMCSESTIFAENSNIEKSSRIIVAGKTGLVGINSETAKAKSSLKYFDYFKKLLHVPDGFFI